MVPCVEYDPLNHTKQHKILISLRSTLVLFRVILWIVLLFFFFEGNS